MRQVHGEGRSFRELWLSIWLISAAACGSGSDGSAGAAGSGTGANGGARGGTAGAPSSIAGSSGSSGAAARAGAGAVGGGGTSSDGAAGDGGIAGAAGAAGATTDLPKLRPPTMGWATWNWFGDRFDAATIQAQANALISSGMLAAGYDTIGIDEGWWDGTRDAGGNITVKDSQWPGGMAAMAEWLHGKGLKAGIYTDAGTAGCGSQYPRYKQPLPNQGSLDHYDQDFLQFSEWGYDFVKVDWCGGNLLHLDPKTQYGQIRASITRAVAQTGLPMTLNICDWGVANPWEWGPGIGDSWRAGGDIGPGAAEDPNGGGTITLDGVLAAFDHAQHPLATHTGFSNDADMMMINFPALSDEDNRTHLALWAMAGGPLRAGHDLTQMSATTVTTLTNRAVIAVDQDAALLQATLVSDQAGLQTYSKVLAGSGKRAVLLLNRSSSAANMSVKWADLGLASGSAAYENVWTGETGSNGDSFSAEVSAHDHIMLVVTGTEGATTSAEAEADASVLAGGAARIPCSACSGGSRVGHLSTGASLTIQGVVAPRAGYARIAINYTNGASDILMNTLVFNQAVATKVAFPPTGSWDTPGTVYATVRVSSGANNTAAFSSFSAVSPDLDSISLGLPALTP